MRCSGSAQRLSRRAFLGIAAGATAAAATERATAQTASPTETDGADTDGTPGAGTVTPAGEVTIDMTDSLVFDPDATTVPPGTTVIWENVGTVGHSVTAYEDEIPGDAEYFASGGFDDEQTARQSYSAGDPDSGDVAGGDSYEHTLTVEGDYEYFCIPHEAAGMVASLTVGQQQQGGQEEEGPGPLPPVAVLVGVLALGTIVAVIGFSYFFLKYGGEYGED
jgi:plastocyanin